MTGATENLPIAAPRTSFNDVLTAARGGQGSKYAQSLAPLLAGLLAAAAMLQQAPTATPSDHVAHAGPDG